MKIKFFTNVLLSIYLVCFGFSAAALAAGFGVVPKQIVGTDLRSWFVYTMNPNESRSDTVIITNNNPNRAMVAVVEGLDAINTAEGGFTLIDGPEKNQDVGKWVSLDRSSVSIPAGKSVEVPFNITVPPDASIGQHSGAIVVYEKPANSTSGVGLKVRIGARIYITVPGKVNRKLTFDKVNYEFKDGKLVFSVKSTNQSNVNIEPALDINIHGLFRNYRQEEKNNGTYLPDSVMNIEKVWQRSAPKLGYYRVNLVLHTWSTEQIMPDGTKTTLPDLKFNYSFSFWLGGRYFTLIAILLLLGWIGFRFAIYWLDRQKYLTKVDVYTVVKGETIMHISEKTGIFPQQLTKFNQLKWPFAINVGDKLMLPVDRLTSAELQRKQQSEIMPSIWQYLFSWQISLYHPTISSRSTSARVAIMTKRPTRSDRGIKSHHQR